MQEQSIKVKPENREDRALTVEERWQDIDFSELNAPQTNKQQLKQEYPPEKKLAAVTMYFSLGSMKETGKQLGIHWSTISYWRRHSSWWDEITNKLRREKQDELDAMMTSYLHEAQEQALDRIKYGDYKLTASGELKRIPMSGRDIALTSVAFFDKRALIRGDATSIARRQDPLKEIKGKLEAFAAFNNAKQIEGKPKKTSADVTKMINDGQKRLREERGEA